MSDEPHAWLSGFLGKLGGNAPPPGAFLDALLNIVIALNALTQATATSFPTVDYEQPTSGSTLTAVTGLGCFELNPAGVLAALTVTLPPTPTDGQLFEITTTQTITALTVNAPGGATVNGGSTMLTGNGGISFRYRSADTTWRRRW